MTDEPRKRTILIAGQREALVHALSAAADALVAGDDEVTFTFAEGDPIEFVLIAERGDRDDEAGG